jgi:hypothetical protein
MLMSVFRRCVAALDRCLPRPAFLFCYGCFANVKNIRNLLFGYGQWKTCFTHKSTDADGDPVPWFTYPAIEYLEGINLSEMAVFEFGSGNSTRYWSKRARSVVAVEDDRSWADMVQVDQGRNMHLVFAESNEEYTAAISLNDETYDVIVIDGTDRLGCAYAISGWLRDGGFVILDDADEHAEAAAVLRSYNLIEVDFSGFAAVISYTKTTSFFFHPSFRPIPRHGQLPRHSTCHPRTTFLTKR